MTNDTPNEPGTKTETPPSPAPPPAAVVVNEGKQTEREIELEKKLTESEAARKKAETDAAYAQDEARRLKEVQTKPPTIPTKSKKIRWTLLHESED